MMKCVDNGHTIVAIVNLYSTSDDEEINSYMYQTVGCHVVNFISEAMQVPLFRRKITGLPRLVNKLDYSVTEDDEVEDLYHVLKTVKDEINFEAVSVGAILSRYQLNRVDHVCTRLGVTPLAYLWNRSQIELLDEMISSGLSAIIIKVASFGLEPTKHLGKSLVEVRDHLVWLTKKYGGNACGEGGEYETITLSCPLFNGRFIRLDETETVYPPNLPSESGVAYLRIIRASLHD